jgi:hypothetical protein
VSQLAVLCKSFAFYVAEGVGFEPTVRLLVRLISSQVHSTTLPPFRFRLPFNESSKLIFLTLPAVIGQLTSVDLEGSERDWQYK